MKKVLFVLLSIVLLASCGKDDDSDIKGIVSLSVYYHYEDTPEIRHLAKVGYCWFGLFDCEQSSISADLQDVYNIVDKNVPVIKIVMPGEYRGIRGRCILLEEERFER